MSYGRSEVLARANAHPNVRRYLDVSTVHLPADLREDLNGCEGVIADRHPFGWWLYVPEDPDDDADVPTPVFCLWQLARQHGCSWVYLDADAPEAPELPRYDP